jgi:hypothetical protein
MAALVALAYPMVACDNGDGDGDVDGDTDGDVDGDADGDSDGYADGDGGSCIAECDGTCTPDGTDCCAGLVCVYQGCPGWACLPEVDPAGCPSEAPTERDACSARSLVCSYGSSVDVVCSCEDVWTWASCG